METSETIRNEDHEENCTFIEGATQARSGDKISNRAKITLLGASLVMVKVVLPFKLFGSNIRRYFFQFLSTSYIGVYGILYGHKVSLYGNSIFTWTFNLHLLLMNVISE